MAKEISDFVQKDARSESTLPLLNYLLRRGPEASTAHATQIFQTVKAGVGKDKPPLDESEQLRDPYMQMIDEGVGKGGKVHGSPKVATLHGWFEVFIWLIRLFSGNDRWGWSVGLVCRLRTKKSWVRYYDS